MTSYIAMALLAGACTLQAGTLLPAGFTEVQVANGLTSATAMAFSPDGRLFVCQQGGALRVISDGTLLATPFVTVTTDTFSERGLLGVTFDPNFAVNRFVYVYYTVPTAPIHNRVSRFTASVTNPNVAEAGSETVVVDLENLSAGNHNGGAIHFGPDGKLYIGVGENAVASNAQSLNNRLGKILRLNADGTIPPDNPTTFPGISGTPTGANRAIWAVGLRNPFTFAFQPGTGRMFINDVGQSTWEEINDGIVASNYGWPICEGDCGNPNFRDPLFQYGHAGGGPTGCAIVGGAFYNPPVNQFPASYVGKYFFADLCSGFIRVMDPSNNTSSAFATGLSTPVDLQIGPEGSLYYLVRGGGGQVWKITATQAQASNISSRSHVASGENVMIGGFIVTGTADKRLIVRGLGPSLSVPNQLTDPRLELRGSTGALIASNNNWRDTQEAEIINSQLAPPNNLESAIIATLQPGAYTAIVQGADGGSGVGLVEVYDLDLAAGSKLANISTRSLVQTGDNRLIGGFILGGNAGATQVIVRAIGPSLTQSGIGNALADPTLELRDSDGALIRANDNWQDDPDQAALIQGSGIPPTNPLESAIFAGLFPGSYTAIVAGSDGSTGIGLVEIYNIP